MKKINIAVLMGGDSFERDISLISGREVVKALNKDKYSIKIYDPAKDILKLIKNKNKIDVVFPVLHGPGGEDGAIQGLLELLKIPYVGSGILASSIAINKEAAKKIYINSKILTPSYKVFKKSDKIPFEVIKIPCVIKPLSQGSSVSINIVKNRRNLKKAIKEVFFVEDKIIIEDYIEGTEVTVGILGNDNPSALPIVEIIPPEGCFFDRKVKYNGSTREIVPARLSKKLATKIQNIARCVHVSLGCRGLSRTDMIIMHQKRKTLSAKAEIYVLETNTLPGMTRESLFPKAARAAGIKFPDLLDKLIEFAFQK